MLVYNRKLIILGLVVSVCFAVAGFIVGYRLFDSGASLHQSYVQDLWLPEEAIVITALQIDEADIKSERISIEEFQSREFPQVMVFRNHSNTEFLYLASSGKVGDDEAVYSAKVTVNHGKGDIISSDFDPNGQKVYIETNNVLNKYLMPWLMAGLGLIVTLIVWFIGPALIVELRNGGSSPEIRFSA